MACVVSASFVALRLTTSAEYEAHGAHQTIYVEPSYLLVTPCTNFTVNVRIRDVVDLYAWQFNMTFDPNLVQCVSVTEGEFLRNVGSTTGLILGVNNTNGWIKAACSLVGAVSGASGGCVLAYVTFHCTSVGGSILGLHDTKLLNSSRVSVPAPPNLGDVNGDGRVDVFDLVIVANAYCSKVGDPRYNPQADLNSDGAVDIEDLIIVALNFGHMYPPSNALQPQNNVIAHTVENGYVQQEERLMIYRYKVKFECRWEIEVVGPCDPTVPSQRIPVETLITTHINVYNPDHRVPVQVFKYFVQCLSEPEPGPPPILIGGHTLKNHTFVIPPNKGFEIDCDDVKNWPVDPNQPPLPPWPCELKGFVVIESWDYPLEVVAVYNKKSADIVNKITFHLNFILPPIDSLIGKLKLYEPYELSVTIPWEPANLTLEEVVKKELGLLPPPPPEPEDIDIEIESTTTFFDFLQCVTKERIVFTLRPTNLLVQKFLNETWPPAERPPGFEWPDWIWPCGTIEILWKPPINWTVDDLGGWISAPAHNKTETLEALLNALIDLGVPLEIAKKIVAALWIDIIDVDVGEGVGASIDVEYIQPEIITGPVP